MRILMETGKQMMSCAILAVIMCGFAAGTALAQTSYIWTQASGGAQSWTTVANWNPAAIPSPVSGDTIQANLTMSAATVLDLGADRTFEIWTSNFQGFGSSQFTISSGNTITLAGTTPTITTNAPAIFTIQLIILKPMPV